MGAQDQAGAAQGGGGPNKAFGEGVEADEHDSGKNSWGGVQELFKSSGGACNAQPSGSSEWGWWGCHNLVRNGRSRVLARLWKMPNRVNGVTRRGRDCEKVKRFSALALE